MTSTSRRSSSSTSGIRQLGVGFDIDPGRVFDLENPLPLSFDQKHISGCESDVVARGAIWLSPRTIRRTVRSRSRPSPDSASVFPISLESGRIRISDRYWVSPNSSARSFGFAAVRDQAAADEEHIDQPNHRNRHSYRGQLEHPHRGHLVARHQSANDNVGRGAYQGHRTGDDGGKREWHEKLRQADSGARGDSHRDRQKKSRRGGVADEGRKQCHGNQ